MKKINKVYCIPRYFRYFDRVLFVTYIIISTRCVRIANRPWSVYLKVENAKWTRRINIRPSTTSGCRRADWSHKLCRCSLPTRRPRQLCIMGVSLCCTAKLCTRVLTHLFFISFFNILFDFLVIKKKKHLYTR